MKNKNFALLVLISFLCVSIFSCKHSLHISYKAVNNSSYTVEFKLDGDLRSLNSGESFIEKRLDSATVELVNNIPVYFIANYADVIFKDKILQTVNVSVKNLLAEDVILDFHIAGINNVDIEKSNEKTFTLSDIEIDSQESIFSNLTVYLKNSSKFEANYTLKEKDGIYYILIS